MSPSVSNSSLVEKAEITTQDGIFVAYFTDRGLAQLNFPSRNPSREFSAKANSTSGIPSHWTAQTRAALKRALMAEAIDDMPPLDLAVGTGFQQSVWQALLGIPPRQTLSYGEVAKQIGRPKALRAVGQACGANPIPVLIPCHRVLAAHGKIGGFSSGLEWKRKLLEREGIRV